MFKHFTFAAQALPTYQLEYTPSPTDTSFPSPASPTQQPWSSYQPDTVDCVVHKFSLHSLRSDDEVPQQFISNDEEDNGALPTPDYDLVIPDFTPEELSYMSTSSGMMTIPSPSTQPEPDLPTFPHPRGGAISCRRLQRQLNVQMQTSSSHLRDINALVEDMIVTNSQCNLRNATSRPYLSSPPPSRGGRDELILNTSEVDNEIRLAPGLSPEEDEGFFEIAHENWVIEEDMTLRRASTPSGIRKHGIMRYRGSADCVATVNSAGRTKVRSVPRMRRRKPKTVPE